MDKGNYIIYSFHPTALKDHLPDDSGGRPWGNIWPGATEKFTFGVLSNVR